MEFTKNQQIEVMMSAGYNRDSAISALNIGVFFFDTKEEAYAYFKNEVGEEITDCEIDTGYYTGENGEPVTRYFYDTSTI